MAEPLDRLTAEPADRATGTAPGKNRRIQRSALLGAMFLMATSAIGPGFITQTTTFTMRLGAAMAFAIFISILVDVAVQLNVWRVLGVSGRRAHELGNDVFKGVGWLLAVLVVIGGLVFNIGNISGTGLGLHTIFGGLDPRIGAAISGVIAVVIFMVKRVGPVMDRIVVLLGLVMIALTTWIAITTHPPVGQALVNTVAPSHIDFVSITTLIGGTVGGYITYAGAHRLIDSGTTGAENAGAITKASVTGIIVTGVMRVVLFLAVLGVLAGGAQLDPANPAASAFQAAAGSFGLVAFGVIFWAAALTSVIGASYTSVSFLTTRRTSERVRSLLTVAFIVITTTLYITIGAAPVKLLVFAGTFNGLILPIGFTVILWAAWRRRDLLHNYKYPAWLFVIGVLAWLLTLYLGYMSLAQGLPKLFA
jgi:Mn2+/Fe2+ NRAMP family transporter